MKDAVVDRAIEKAGGASALARRLGIKPPAISQWRRIPAERVLEVEKITGISRYELRPDVFGPAPRKTSVSADALRPLTVAAAAVAHHDLRSAT